MLTLTEEQYQTIEMLSGLDYTVKMIADYFEMDARPFHIAYKNKDSEFRYHFDRGILLAKAETEMKMLESAKSGNLTALMMYRKAMQEREFTHMRDKCINGEL